MENIIEKENMSSPVECLNSLVKSGYTTQFAATEKGLISLATNKVYQPDEVKIENFFRFEGESDPADNSILYAIETATEKGTLTDSYGANNDAYVTKFIKEVEDIHKHV
jgi:hypothetical protein